MTMRGLAIAMTAVLNLAALHEPPLQAQGAAKKKVFIDQDLGGAMGTDNQSMLMLLQAPELDIVGIGIVAGDGQVKASTAWTLRMLELTGYGHVPVAQGAKFPLINSREETELWEAQFGVFGYKGAWNPARYHGPDEIPVLEPGKPTIKAIERHAALFLIETVRKNPGEVILWCGGPLTNVALALALDPELPELVKELVLMGAGFNVDKGGNHRINGRREFNWWWDPEAVRMVMRAPWKKITITPVDISVKTSLSQEMRDQIAKSNTPVAQYHTKYSRPGAGGGGVNAGPPIPCSSDACHRGRPAGQKSEADHFRSDRPSDLPLRGNRDAGVATTEETHICSGCSIPSRSKPTASVRAVRSTSASRLDRVGSSLVSTGHAS